jgi:hypothetical protein
MKRHTQQTSPPPNTARLRAPRSRELETLFTKNVPEQDPTTKHHTDDDDYKTATLDPQIPNL